MNEYAATAGISCIEIHHYYVNVQTKRKNQKFTRFREKHHNEAREYVAAAQTSCPFQECEGQNVAVEGAQLFPQS